LYQPNIALLSGIAWDHINVFPTFDNYVEQFRIFANQITRGGILVYNEEDEAVKAVAEGTENPIRKIAYQTPSYTVENGTTLLDTPEGPMPIEVFGAHNLSNLAGAKWLCQCMGVDEAEFYEAIASFKGASKRLEKIAESANKVAYKDFAHSPSKVSATTKAVKAQYPDRKLIACLELHTYSSLNAEFLKEYQGALDAADVAVVFYSPDAVKIKRLEEVTYDQIAQSFQREDLIIYTNPAEFKDFLFSQNLDNSALLLMSSGNYGGLNFDEVKGLIN
jgi:UDP-N-acetylmuramate: L-alanyl-gamma-D-glutamyl-meso-diaminopimelate ligase